MTKNDFQKGIRVIYQGIALVVIGLVFINFKPETQSTKIWGAILLGIGAIFIFLGVIVPIIRRKV